MYGPLDILSWETWALLITAVLTLRYYVHQRFQLLRKLGIPHNPPSILKLGNLNEMREDPDSFFKKDLERKEKFGYVYGSYIGLTPRIAISDPVILKQIQIKESQIFRDRQRSFSRMGGKEMNTSLTSAQGDHWKRLRNTLSPVFSTAKLKEMIGIVERCTDKMVKNLEKNSKENDGKVFPKDFLGKLSLDVICSSAFNVDVHTQDENNENSQMLKMGRKLFDVRFAGKLLFSFVFMFPSLEKLAEYCGVMIFPKDSVKYFAGLVDQVIKKKDDDKARVDLMRLMLNAKIPDAEAKKAVKGLTRNEIVGNSILMILAGFETTGNTMMFVAYNLASYKDEQDKARAEIQQAVENHGGLTYEALLELKFLTQCIHETLRIYPAIIRNSRYCEKEITINGVTIPAGVHVDIPSYGMGRDEEYWDEPLVFKPDRMEDMNKIDPMVFQPFGAGPRNCIGMRFALMEMKMALAKILLAYELDVCSDTPKPPIDITFKASVQPKVPIPLRITPLQPEE